MAAPQDCRGCPAPSWRQRIADQKLPPCLNRSRRWGLFRLADQDTHRRGHSLALHVRHSHSRWARFCLQIRTHRGHSPALLVLPLCWQGKGFRRDHFSLGDVIHMPKSLPPLPAMAPRRRDHRRCDSLSSESRRRHWPLPSLSGTPALPSAQGPAGQCPRRGEHELPGADRAEPPAAEPPAAGMSRKTHKSDYASSVFRKRQHGDGAR